MGVYIKGMEMSEIEKLVLAKNVQLVFCWTSHMTLTAKTKAESKDGTTTYSKEFEVVKVPEPHGRLIDENDVIDAIYERLKELQTHPEFKKKHGDIDLIGVMPYIAKIKTVIEAEGE